MTNGDLSARMWSVRFALFDRYADTQITSAREGEEWAPAS